MLPRTHRMELLSRAYVQAVVVQAGGICAVPSPDFGIDFSVHNVSKGDAGYDDQGAVFDLQVKSTTEATLLPQEDAFQYDLDIKAYNFLRKNPVKSPRYLVLFVMPKDESLWIAQDHDELVLRHCAYYLSLRGMGETENRRTVAAVVPRRQVFSVAFIKQLLDRSE